jgi:Fe-S cluster assembly protein SufD
MAVATRPRAEMPVPAFSGLFAETAPRLPGGPTLDGLRRASFARFAELGLPTSRDEAWKYTNLARRVNQPMRLAPAAEPGVEALAGHLAGGHAARRLIFVNGRLDRSLSHVASLPPGVEVKSVARMLEEAPERVAEAVAGLEDGRSFTALNTAFLADGAWIELADGAALEQPLQLLFLTRGQPDAVIAHPRCFLRLGQGARLHLLETHGDLGGGAALTNLVVQLELGAGAELRHDRLQRLGSAASLVGKLHGRLGAGARLTQTVATIGGALVRNESTLEIVGSGVECLLNGVYMPTGEEHVDTLIRIDHKAPGSHSDQFYKGIVDGRAHAAFQGKIVVHPDAQQTNAFQTNNNLLLSDDAELDTKPELEIYADDVKCSHGATSGDLDPLKLFYLRSRGLDEPVARSLITFAFAAEILARLGDATLKEQARRAALARLPGGLALEDML